MLACRRHGAFVVGMCQPIVGSTIVGWLLPGGVTLHRADRSRGGKDVIIVLSISKIITNREHFHSLDGHGQTTDLSDISI